LFLNLARAQKVMEILGSSCGLDATQAALGIIEVVNAHMERALRVISIERGHDPQDFTLLSFGGAGGLHATDLARRLRIPRVLIPPYASVLSALGMLAADVVKDYSQTIMLPGDSPYEEILIRMKPLQALAYREMKLEGFSPKEVSLQPALDMRYQGQSYELTIPLAGADAHIVDHFNQVYQKVYGYAQLGAPVEVVNLRVRALGRVNRPPLPTFPASSPDPTQALLGRHPVTLFGPHQQPITRLIPLLKGEYLLPGNQLHGPALVVRDDTTILLSPEDHAVVDPHLNLWVNIQPMDS
jgi:N-methylhydantoinase A